MFPYQKRGHKVAQQGAFHSPKDNPFSSYSYDPNSIERSLNSSANGSRNQVQSSIIPSTAARNFSSTSKATYSKFRTPATRRKGSAASSRMSGSSLLQQKAMEMNHYQKTSGSSRFNNSSAQMQRSIQSEYHTDDFGEDPDVSFYNPHLNSMPSNRHIMEQSFTTGSRPRFTQNFTFDAHFHQSHHHYVLQQNLLLFLGAYWLLWGYGDFSSQYADKPLKNQLLQTEYYWTFSKYL